jgi:hypothetical protein
MVLENSNQNGIYWILFLGELWENNYAEVVMGLGF